MTPHKELNLYNQAKTAIESLRRHFRYGAYRVIRDPEGVVSLWAVEGNARAPFSISFAAKGRVYTRIEDIPQDFLLAFSEYVSRTVR